VITPIVLPSHEAMSQRAAAWLIEAIRQRPDALLCAASGSTPNLAYELFAEQCFSAPSLCTRLRLIKLDEWGGLPMDDPATCETHLQRVLVKPLSLGDRYASFVSDAEPEPECQRIGAWLNKQGPIDICVLGLGLNGHLGFNEPHSFLRPHAHVAKLSDTSLTHTMLQQSGRRPTHGLTLGMADLLQSREVLLLVSGETKRAALARLLQGEISPQFPASFLHLHPAVTLLCDEAAMS
jgi:galactosamine-6-phosphate isomerase